MSYEKRVNKEAIRLSFLQSMVAAEFRKFGVIDAGSAFPWNTHFLLKFRKLSFLSGTGKLVNVFRNQLSHSLDMCLGATTWTPPGQIRSPKGAGAQSR